MIPLVLFASGRGSNVQAIIDYFEEKNSACVSLIVCNNPKAGVLDIADKYHIPTLLINKQILKGNEWIDIIKSYHPGLVVLAGFLWKIPATLIRAFPQRIINIHPALLPKYGGKGMYGMHVHRAVVDAGDRESGISIHYVNEHYDEGNIIVQARCMVTAADSPEAVAGKIHELEHFFFPRTIDFLLRQ